MQNAIIKANEVSFVVESFQPLVGTFFFENHPKMSAINACEVFPGLADVLKDTSTVVDDVADYFNQRYKQMIQAD
jgi:hypothetical protein